jgi:hypothetical protein
MSDIKVNLYLSIIKNAEQYEDGSLGLTRCVEIYCEEHDVSLNDGYEAVAWHEMNQALSHGVPLSVIKGDSKLSDHFSLDYINWKCNIDNNAKI